MPLVPAICTQCKGTLQVDPNKKSGVCPFCGTVFLTESVINNYNVTNVQNTVTNIGNLHTDNVTFQDNKSADSLYKKAVTFLNFKEYSHALNSFTEMVNIHPYDHRGWKGMMLASTNNLDKMGVKTEAQLSKLKDYYDHYVKAKELAGVVIENDPVDKYLPFAKQLFEKYRIAQVEGTKIFYNVKIAGVQGEFDKKYTGAAFETLKAEAESKLPELKKERNKALNKGFSVISKVFLVISVLLILAVTVFFLIGFFTNITPERMNAYEPGEHVFDPFGEPLFGLRFDTLLQSFIFGLSMIIIAMIIVLGALNLLIFGLMKFFAATRKNRYEIKELDEKIEKYEKILDGRAYREGKEQLDHEIQMLKFQMDSELRKIK